MKPVSAIIRKKVPANLQHAIRIRAESDDDDGTEYIETDRGDSQIGVPHGPGVVVPVETNEGGLASSRYSVYGKIIMGSRITKKGHSPLRMHSKITERAPSIYDDEDMQSAPQPPPATRQEARREARAQNPSTQAPSIKSSVETVPAPAPSMKQRVVLSGSFGRYSGNYLAWEESSKQIVLISSLDDANFVPPVSDDPITIRIGERSFMGVFRGTAFGLECYKSEVTVFDKHELSDELAGAN